MIAASHPPKANKGGYQIRTFTLGGTYEQENKSPDHRAVQGDYTGYERRLLRLPPQ
jgi:hypothetical protein